jgi:hypothetical protein
VCRASGLAKRASPRMRVVPRRQHCPLRARSAHPPMGGPDVVDTVTTAFTRWGTAASVLTDIQSGCAVLSLSRRPAGKDRCRPAPARRRCLTD